MTTYEFIVSGNLGKHPIFLIDTGSETFRVTSRREIGFNFFSLLRHIRLQYFKSKLGYPALLKITTTRLIDSYQLYPKPLLHFLFCRYVISVELIQVNKNAVDLSCISKSSITPTWVSRQAQMKGVRCYTSGQDLEWDMFRGSDISRIYVLEFIEIESLKDEGGDHEGLDSSIQFKRISRIEVPSGNVLEIKTLTDALVDRTQFVASNSVAFPVLKFDYFDDSSIPTPFVTRDEKGYGYFCQSYKTTSQIESATMIPFSTSWYHFVVEGLGAYLAIEDQLKKLPIIITNQCHKNICDLVTAVTGQKAFILYPQHCLMVKELQLIRDWRFIHRFDLLERSNDLMMLASRFEKLFIDNCQEISTDYDLLQESDIVFVCRPDGLSRPMSNIEQAKRKFIELGIRVVDTSQMEIRQVANTIRQAKCVVIETGAAMTNLLFARKGCVVLEINPSGFEPNFWRSFCSSLNLNHFLVEAKAVPGTRQNKFHFPIGSVLTHLKQLGLT